jgi:hypothetical protein
MRTTPRRDKELPRVAVSQTEKDRIEAHCKRKVIHYADFARQAYVEKLEREEVKP